MPFTSQPHPLTNVHAPSTRATPIAMSQAPKSTPAQSQHAPPPPWHSPAVHDVTPPQLTASQSLPYVTPSHPHTGIQIMGHAASGLMSEGSMQSPPPPWHSPGVHDVTPPPFTAMQSLPYVTPSHPHTGIQIMGHGTLGLMSEGSTQSCARITFEPTRRKEK